MTRQVSCVPYGADYYQTFAHSLFYQLRELVVKIRLLVITARRDIDYANAVLLALLQNPFESTKNILFGDVPGLPNLDQNQVGVRRYAAIKTLRERAVASRHNRSHHAVPASHIWRFKRYGIALENAVVGEYAIHRLR